MSSRLSASVAIRCTALAVAAAFVLSHAAPAAAQAATPEAADAPKVADPHATTLAVYELPAGSRADGDMAKWKGVPASTDKFKFFDRDELLKPDDGFAPSLYAGRPKGSDDLLLLVVVKDRMIYGEESGGWVYGDCLELYLDFGRAARAAADPNWWTDRAKWTKPPEMAQFGFLPRTNLRPQMMYNGPTCRPWKLDYVSLPIEGGFLYEIRVDGKSVLADLKLPALPDVIGIDLGLVAVDYPVIFEGGGWVNHRGIFRMFGDHTASNSPVRYGGLSLKPAAPSGDALPAVTLASLYGKSPTLEQLRKAKGNLQPHQLADLVYWTACSGRLFSAALVKQLLAVDDPAVRQAVMTVMTDPQQDRDARLAAIEAVYEDVKANTPAAIVMANLVNAELSALRAPQLAELLRHEDLTVAFTAAAALSNVGTADDLKAFGAILAERRAAMEKDAATKPQAAAVKVFMQPALDSMVFRLNPPPLPKQAAVRTAQAANADLPRMMANDNNNWYDSAKLLRRWPKGGPRELWRYEIGSGLAAVTEAGGKVFALGCSGDKQTAYCFDAAKGTLLWKKELVARKPAYAAPCPVVDGDKVYFVPEGGVFCLGVQSGEVVWSEQKAYAGGVFSCPLIVGELLILPASTLVAIDKASGVVKWKAPGGTVSPASPAYQEVDGVGVIVAGVGSGTGAEIQGISIADGSVFFRYPVKIGYGLCTSPVVVGSRVYVSSGVPGQEFFTCLQMFVVDGRIRALPAYSRRDTQANFCNTVAVVDGAVYGFSGQGLDCTSAADGKLLWRSKPNGVGNSSQLIAADGLLFVQAGQDMVLAELSKRAWRELSRFTVPVPVSQQQHTLANGRLYVRGATTIVCYDVAKE